MKAAFSCCCSGKESLKLNEQKLSPIHQDEADKYSIFGKKYVTSGAKNSVLKVKQKFWSMTGNDYDVMDMNDDKEEKIAFKVKGEKWSLRKQKKKIFDSDGKPVFSIFGTGWFHHKQAVKKLDAKEEEGEQDICTINSNCPNTVQYTEDGISGKNKFYLKSHMSYCAYSGGTIWLLKNPDTTSSPLETSGKEGASPADTGAICIAKMYSPVTAKSFALPGKWTPQDYVVEIAPGVDQALILAWILAYAEMDDADNH